MARRSHNSPAAARALGIAAIYQQPALFPDLTVAENIALALEPPASGEVDWRARQRQARDCSTARAPRSTRSRGGTLTMPEQQIVEIAKAIGAEARVLILDEPTASLSDTEVESLFRVIRELKRGRGHDLYLAPAGGDAAIADRVTVLRDGETIGTRN